MRTRIIVPAAVLGAVVLGAVTMAIATGPDRHRPLRIHVIEHAITDTVIDTGPTGDSAGDLLTFHNPLFGPRDQHRVGHDQGDCIRISPEDGSWECRWVAWVAGGSITVEGPFFDAHDSVFAITGGTGAFRNARGSMALSARPGETAFDFVYTLTG
ncbi:MAG TPA: allene oxide cyclase family protein [Actinomycetota bacterium]|jgi:hypothetical protein